jgi:hypothetical protein
MEKRESLENFLAGLIAEKEGIKPEEVTCEYMQQRRKEWKKDLDEFNATLPAQRDFNGIPHKLELVETVIGTEPVYVHRMERPFPLVSCIKIDIQRFLKKRRV